MADSKNHFVKKQDETVVEVDVPDKDLKILIRTIAMLTATMNLLPRWRRTLSVNTRTIAIKLQEVHTNRRESSFETTDFEALKRQQALERVYAKKPKFTLVPDEDDFGTVKGYTVYTRLTHPSGLQEMKERYFSIDQLADFGG